ncbi:hypothetical protein [Falsiphaeobacter marinintestinus]|uniref:hypothetical protein n=1 Tax=Falsiphaeobacter marinintestinus TaxID=1492905 RepID=UPI0011B7734A|nr:hypothetical protein [Phaeobacter marinintestinus]
MTTSPQIAEIVTFRLAAGAGEAAFVEAAASVETMLTTSGQMLARTLSKSPDGTWSDHIVWSDEAAARAAATEVMQSPACAPFMSLIDPDSVQMSHGTIARRMDETST